MNNVFCIILQMQRNPGTQDIKDRISVMGTDHVAPASSAVAQDLGLASNMFEGLGHESHFAKKSSVGERESSTEAADRLRVEQEMKA